MNVATPVSTGVVWGIGAYWLGNRSLAMLVEDNVGSSRSFDVPDVDCVEAWSRLSADPSAVLVDVRTRAEWAFVGVPVLEGRPRGPVFVEWQTYPDGAVDNAFVARLMDQLNGMGVERIDPLLFLCRSGVRSRSAAAAMLDAGYESCTNISDGFEGPLDEQRHRGTVSGWKANDLPWAQS